MAQGESGFQKGRVSVVTPVYNGESHLRRMLDSVLEQTCQQVEMILVDDGSADGTVRIAEGYLEKFARRGYDFRIVKAEHKNASAAINQGLLLVTGEYLIWPDSDDVLEPESIKKRVEFLQAHLEYQCVRSLSYYFDEETGQRSEKADEQRGDLSKEELFWDILESRTFVCCGCYMLRTESFFAVYPNRRIPEYDVGQNFQMLLPFMYRHKCPTLQEELYGVAIRSGSHSRTALTQAQEEKKYRDYENLIDEIAENCRITDPSDRDRIACWKAARRYRISLKYRHRKEAFQALRRLRSCGGFSTREALKELIWAYFVNGWVEEHLYPVYRKISGRFS